MSFSSNTLLWDSRKPLLSLDGKGAKRFLHGQTTSDFNSLDIGDSTHSCWLTSTGRVRALLEIQLVDNGAEVLVLAGDPNALVKGFEQVIFPADQVKLESFKTIRRLQLMRMPESKNALDLSDVTWVDDGEPFPEHLQGFKAATACEVESWRLKRGIPIGSGELNGEYNPFELGLADWVSLEKGCYLGQETLAKLVNKSSFNRKLKLWETEHLASSGDKLMNLEVKNGKRLRGGLITSSMKDSNKFVYFGLAMVHKDSFGCEQLFLEKDSLGVHLATPKGFVEPLNS